MSTPTDPLDALIAAYVQAIEAGQVPNRRELLDQNPDQAQALQNFFADFDRMDRVAVPLRLAGAIDETAALETNGLTKLPTLRYFGDYELLEEVARGGMGVVYKARQTSLNRLVALKMILAGTFATPREVARFQAEAEAAANLDHPHIVPVYEVGEHEGQQYFSMKFIEGGSLANHPRGEVKAEVQGLIAIARAVHHAHQHGVLHRDLKPSNVLIDPRGDRHVTDFGLAKRLTDLDRSLTEAGQILGTPRYMSPEQAAGRKDLTVATDIYALGVILYERLTGRTPFQADNVVVLLQQVRESEPPPPSSIVPGLGRDLETIALKCLDKDPTRRYPTAEALASDLENWQTGRPINARPVGQAEKLVRWCRRNPAVAGLSASVALALMLGTLISSLFAFQERKARIRAEKAEDATERAFARSLVKPFNLDLEDDGNSDDYIQALSEPEVEALWELASSGTESLRDRFLEEAIRDPLALRQLYARSGNALNAALGLDADRRARAAQLILERLRHPGLPFESRIELAFLLLEIDDGASPWAEEASKIIIRGLEENPKEDQTRFLVQKIVDSCDLISPSIAASLLVAGMTRTNHSPWYVAGILEDLFKRLDRKQALFVSRLISRSIDQVPSDDARFYLVKPLGSLTARIDPVEASSLCGPAARSFASSLSKSLPYLRSYNDKTQDGLEKRDKLEESGHALATLAERLDSTEADSLCGPIARAIAQEINPELEIRQRLIWAEILASLAPRLDPTEAASLCGPVARTIARDLGPEIVQGDQRDMATILASLTARIDSADGLAIFRSAAQKYTKSAYQEASSESPNKIFWFITDIEILSSRLEDAEAATFCEPFAQSAAQDFHQKININNTHDYYSFALLLSKLAARLDDAKAASLCGPIARAIARDIKLAIDRNIKITTFKNSSAHDLTKSTRALASLAARLVPVETNAICGIAAREIAQAIERESDSYGKSIMAEAVGSLVPWLKPAEVENIAWSLVHSIGTESDDVSQLRLVEALASLIGHVRNERSLNVMATVLQSGPGGVWKAAVRLSSEPFPFRLTSQNLVDLLKVPTCFGATRRVVLDQLEIIHGRRFANHWEFVRFAREKGLKLDFTSPPRRPDPKASLERLLVDPASGR